MKRSAGLLLAGLLAWPACDGPAPMADDGGTPADARVPGQPDAADRDASYNEPDPPKPNSSKRLPKDDDGCPGIYSQSLLPSFSLEIAPEELAALEDEWLHGEENREDGLPVNPDHPLSKFVWEDVEITNATIRLRGNPVWWFDDVKMQFQVSFNDIDSKGRFLGQRKIVLDAASANRSYLRDRLSLKVLRDAGLPAPCANNARVYVNGEYYGLYTNVERVDKEFLERAFEDPEGDLWKRANWELKTNEETSNNARLTALRAAQTPAQLAAYMDIPQAIRLWAADAILPNSDGPWAGGLNFYLYDDPTSGKFVHIPWDYDNGITRLVYYVDPFVWHKEERFYGRPFYDISLGDPAYFDMYLDSIDDVLHTAYDTTTLQTLLFLWAKQIDAAAMEDPNRPFTYGEFQSRVQVERAYVFMRFEFIEDWLECWRAGGVANEEGYCEPPQGRGTRNGHSDGSENADDE